MEIFALKWQPFYLNIILFNVTHCLAKLLHLAFRQDTNLESSGEQLHFVLNALVSLQCRARSVLHAVSLCFSRHSLKHKVSPTAGSTAQLLGVCFTAFWLVSREQQSNCLCSLWVKIMSLPLPSCYTGKPFDFSFSARYLRTYHSVSHKKTSLLHFFVFALKT